MKPVKRSSKKNQNTNPNLDSSEVLKIRNHAINEQHDYTNNSHHESRNNAFQHLKTSTKPIKSIQSIDEEIRETKNAIDTTPASHRAKRIQLLKKLNQLYDEKEKLESKKTKNHLTNNDDLSK